MERNPPTYAGQPVTDTIGSVGITTTDPNKYDNIGVMWVGGSYSVLYPVDELTRIKLIKQEL